MAKETKDYVCFTKPAELHKAVNTLRGIAGGITSDGQITDDEVAELVNWCNLHRFLSDRHPFDEIISTLDEALADNQLTPNEMQDICWLCANLTNNGAYYDFQTSAIQQLQGLLHGLLSDNDLSEREIKLLRRWIMENDFLKATYPYDEIEGLLVSVLADGVITDDERAMLKAFFSTFINTGNSYNLSDIELESLRKQYNVAGICAVEPKIVFAENLFCFTGKSHKFSRNEIAQTIEKCGGLYSDIVVSSTRYLVIGNGSNPCWAFACYGRKVEQAIKLREKGHPIILVHENDFWDAVADIS